MDWRTRIHSTVNQKIIASVIFYFLVTFILSRLTVYLVLGKYLPNFFLTVRGVHIHHFIYGVIILVLVELYLLLRRPDTEEDIFKLCVALYGIGLGLTFDEFGMWVRLEDEYWVRQSYDAVIIVLLLLLNISYYRQVFFVVKEVGKILKKIILRLFGIQIVDKL